MKNKTCHFNISIRPVVLDNDIMKRNEGATWAWGQGPCLVYVPRTKEAVGQSLDLRRSLVP